MRNWEFGVQDELDRVRYLLDRLVIARLLCRLSANDENEYEMLSRRERELMTLANAASN